MAEARAEVAKTYKLFIGGQFPRSESGRSIAIAGERGRARAYVAHASRKDFRNAVEAAAGAQRGWAEASAYNRGLVLYRLAEMLEGRRGEFVGVLQGARRRNPRRAQSQRPDAEAEVATAIDRLVCFAGWADKYAQVLGCHNPVAGPYYNFTIPEPTGVVAVIAPDDPALLGLISLLAPPLCAGNAIVAVAGEGNPLPGALLGELCATSDVPPGVINLLTGLRAELVPPAASHREVNAIHAAGVSADEARALREGTADNLKRVTVRDGEHAPDWYDDRACHSPWWIEPFVDMKTVWHPASA